MSELIFVIPRCYHILCFGAALYYFCSILSANSPEPPLQYCILHYPVSFFSTCPDSHVCHHQPPNQIQVLIRTCHDSHSIWDQCANIMRSDHIPERGKYPIECHYGLWRRRQSKLLPIPHLPRWLHSHMYLRVPHKRFWPGPLGLIPHALRFGGGKETTMAKCPPRNLSGN